MAIRQQIVEQHCKGHSLIDTAELYHLCYSTVRGIWKRYVQKGWRGLEPHYFHCGVRSQSNRTAFVKRAVIWLKRLHPRWGAALIRLKLQQRYARAHFPCERTLQRWIKAAGLQRVKTSITAPAWPWAFRVHDTWQIDAKEKLTLGHKARACYLTVVDEKSGTLLGAFVFPPLLHQ